MSDLLPPSDGPALATTPLTTSDHRTRQTFTREPSSPFTPTLDRVQDQWDKDLPPKPLPDLPDFAEQDAHRSATAASFAHEQSDLEMNDLPAPADGEDRTGLLDEDKMAHQHRRGTLLSRERSFGDEPDFDPAQLGKALANKAFIRNVIINSILIALWYIFSIAISVYNKWMFSKSPNHNVDGTVVFPFPLFTTSFHMVMQFCLASLVLYFFPRFRPRHEMAREEARNGPSLPRADGLSEERKPLITPAFYFSRIVPCGTATGLDIGLGNTSLKFITLTFFTMCKSSTLGFVLAFAIIFGLEKASWRLGAIIFFMTVGVIMMVAGETAFDIIGFVLLMMASFFSGLRWSLTQIMLRRNPATSNPFASIFFLTPIMFLVLLVLALPLEGIGNIKDGFDALVAQKGLFMGTTVLLFPGVIAFLMVASEFALLKRTSVVTLSVCGIFKEVITITAAGIIFGDDLTPINISGLVVTICAIAAYNYMRMRSMKRRADQKAAQHLEQEGLAPASAVRAGSVDHANVLHDSESSAPLFPQSPSAGDDVPPYATNGHAIGHQRTASTSSAAGVNVAHVAATAVGWLRNPLGGHGNNVNAVNGAEAGAARYAPVKRWEDQE